MEEYKRLFDEEMKKLDEQLSSVPYADVISEKLNVRKCYIALILGVNLVLAVIFSLGLNIIGNVITFAYPVYASFASLKTGKIEEEPKWLTYWILYALSCVLDSMGLVHSVIPYFSLVRFIFLVLCFIPQVNLAMTIYEKAIVPKLLVNEKSD